MKKFADRREAGKALATQLGSYAGRGEVLVFGLPRGGVVVADEVAKALSAPLDALIVRKIGHPSAPEYAIGAIAAGDVTLINHSLARPLDVPEREIRVQVEKERKELD